MCVSIPLLSVCYLIKSKQRVSNSCENLRMNVALQAFAFLSGLHYKLRKLGSCGAIPSNKKILNSVTSILLTGAMNCTDAIL